MPGALSLPSVPSFSEQQVHDLVNIIHSVMQQYLAPQYQPPLASAPSTPPASQETQKEEDIQLLQQATVESTTESTTKQDSSMPYSNSTLSIISCLCIIRFSEDSAVCVSNEILLAYLANYIKYSKGIEKTGQGWLLPARVQNRDTHQGYSVYLSHSTMRAWSFLFFVGICYGYPIMTSSSLGHRASLGASPHISGHLP